MIGIINYGAGNIFSLTAALERLGIPYGMVNTSEDLESFSRYIIPGVGHAGAAMEKLRKSGLMDTIKDLKKPVLGICVGMQLLTAFSEEGNTEMLGICPLNTMLFKGNELKVPHMGWNTVFSDNDPLFKGIPTESQFYFVHSYFIERSPDITTATTKYGIEFSAALRSGNFYGVQFHPEKSGKAGEQLLVNFSEI